MQHSVRKLTWLMVALLACGNLRAQTTLISSSSVFSGAATLVNFNAILPKEIAITNQFSGQGVTFSTGLLSMTQGADLAYFPSNGGGVIASDWNYSLGTLTAPGNATWTATFSSLEMRVGFLLEVNSGDTTQLTTYLNGTPTGSVTLSSSGLSSVFFGAQNLSGFNSITVSVTGTSNHFLAMDDFRFEAIPEPSTFALVAVGLFSLGFKAMRRSRVV